MRRMRIELWTRHFLTFLYAALLVLAPLTLNAADSKIVQGPSTIAIGDLAEMYMPAGYYFVPQSEAGSALKAMGNFPTGKEQGILFEDIETNPYFAIFEWDDVGYVKDPEKEKLDPEALLESIRKGTEAANKQRVKDGGNAIQVVGWAKEPFYNAATQRLEWCVIGQDGDAKIVNYNTRILGRQGVMSVVVVTDYDRIDKVMAEMNRRLGDFEFKAGGKYAEWMPGDKVAKLGLAALILGGTAALAYKTGILAMFAQVFAKAGKALFVFLIGIVVAIKKFFFGSADDEDAAARPVEKRKDSSGPPEDPADGPQA